MSALRVYAALVLAEGVAVALLALWWRRTKRILDGRPPRITFRRKFLP